MPPPTREEVNALIENPPAFPFQPFSLTGFARDTVSSEGMTLRDWFAGQALAGTTSEGEAMKFFMAKGKNEYAAAYKLLAEDSYAIADAMLAARKLEATP